MWNFYPRSPCGERPHPVGVFVGVVEISIHALLAESDSRRSNHLQPTSISIHALLAESDSALPRKAVTTKEFLSTLSLRRATQDKFSIPSAKKISIHALLAESDKLGTVAEVGCIIFLSTLSLRRATGIFTAFYADCLFLSTLSLRRATALDQYLNEQDVFLSTLSLRRATLSHRE